MQTDYDHSVKQANLAVRANLSPRYRRLDRFEQYVETTQYDGKPDWFVDDDDKPLRERRPCIQYPIVAEAIDSNTDLCLGEGRFPNITVDSDDDTEDGTDNQRKLANAALAKLTKVSRLKAAFRENFTHAQGCGTTLAICGFRFGRPTVDVERAKWSTPTFSADGKTLKSLEIFYPYTKELRDPDGSWRVKAYLYRRVIDEKSDTTFKPIEANVSGRLPTNWTRDNDQSFEHGLGFCPVVWYPFMIGCSTVARFDGRPIHARSMDEIFALDVSLSQRHRAAFFAGDPQIVLKNASEVRSGIGRTLQVMRESVEAQARNENFAPLNPDHKNPDKFDANWPTTATRPALKKSPGQMWNVEGDNAEVDLLTLPGDALRAIDEDAKDLRNKVCEALAVSFTDPESIRYASALSGKAQKLLKARQLDRCDQYREDMADGLIIPVVQMLIRIMRRYENQLTNRVLKTGLAAFKVLESIDLDLQWGDYWPPDSDEEFKTAQLVNEADKALPLPDAVKARKLAPALDIENPADLVNQVNDERERRVKEAQERMKSEADAFHGKAASDNGAVGTGNRGAAGAGPAKDAGSGSSPVAAPPPKGRAVPGR